MYHLNETKFRLGIFKNNTFGIMGKDFIMNARKTIGQYITSNWFKEEIIPGETVYLFIIRYKDTRELSPLLQHAINDDYQVIDHFHDNPFIIGTFAIVTDEIIFEQDKRITHVVFENIHTDQKKTTMDLSIVIDNVGRIFIYGPCIELP